MKLLTKPHKSKPHKSRHNHNTPKYFKITNYKELHYNFQYKTGLNKDIIPFNPNGSCVAGGLYFVTKQYVPAYYNFGVWIREVTLPVYDPEFKMVQDENKFRANMIILGERYSLLDELTYKKFGFNIPSHTQMIRYGLKYGAYDEVCALLFKYGNQITELNLSGLGITSIPKCLTILDKLEALYLNNNNITIIPEEIQKMPSLKEIHLCNNNFYSPLKYFMIGNIKVKIRY